MRNNQSIQIKALIEHMLCILHQMAQHQERRFVCQMPTEIFTGGIIPPPVKQLEYTANFIIPSHGKIGTGKIGKIHKVYIFLIGKSAPSKAEIKITHQSQRNGVLNIYFDTLIGTGTLKNPIDAPLPVH